MSFEGSSTNYQNDFLKVRVFLYKYTPPFTRTDGEQNKSLTPSLSQQARFLKNSGQPEAPAASVYEDLLKVARFDCPLDPAYFSRFEITPFLHNYSVTQSIKDMENALSISFLNDIISMADLTCPVPKSAPTTSAFAAAANAAYTSYSGSSSVKGIRRPAFFPKKTMRAGVDDYTNYETTSTNYLSADQLITNNAQYYTETATEFGLDAIRTEVAMRLRGVKDPARLASLQQDFALVNAQNPGGLTAAAIREAFRQANDPTAGVGNDLGSDGLLLSDLIQKFDMISVVVYRWPFPPSLVEASISAAQPNLFDTEPMMFACPSTLLPTSKILPSASKNSTIPLYESEFLGFVTSMNFSANPGSSSPMVAIRARSISSLLDSSRRVYAATIYQAGVFDVGEMPNTDQCTLFENALQGFKKDAAGNSRTTSPIDMLKVLLGEFYHIKFYGGASQVLSVGTTSSSPVTCFIDIQEMEYNNNVLGKTRSSSHTMFTPADKINVDSGGTGPVDANGALLPYPYPGSPSRGSTNFLSVPAYLYALVMRMRKFNVRVGTEYEPRLYSMQADAVGDSPLKINANFFSAGIFTPYFARLSDSLGQYNPSTKTPKEIIQEINALTYTEFFETPGGRLVFRTPQYNNITRINTGTSIDSDPSALMVDSTQIIPINYTYSDTKEHLISGLQMSTSMQIMPGDIPLLYPRYVNGKLLSQYGFFQEQPFSNPNAIPRSQSQQVQGEQKGMFEFCRFFYEFNNSVLKNGIVSYVGNSQVEIGQTFFDVTNQKFGYVTAVSKQAEVGGTYTASASLSMVRNAMPVASSTTPVIILPEVYSLPTLESVVNAFSGKSAPTDSTPLGWSTESVVDRTLAIQTLSVLGKSATAAPLR